MTAQLSAGILLHRPGPAGGREVWIAHMGGPFWARRDAAAWSIPKGEYAEPEDPLTVALREFEEEIGVTAPALDYDLLGVFRQRSGKQVTVFHAEHTGRLEWVASNTFELEWPRGSGRMRAFPEVDRAGWVTAHDARRLLVAGQVPMLDALEDRLSRKD